MKLVKSGWQIVKCLWSCGLLNASPMFYLRAVGAWWRFQSTFAFVARVGALRAPDGIAVKDEEGALTFHQLGEQMEGWARFLHSKRQVRPGRQIAILCGNHRHFVLSLLACTRLGADVLPLSCHLPGSVLGKILQRQNISLVLHDSELEPLLLEHAPAIVGQDVTQISPLQGAELPRVRRAGQLVTLTSGTTGISKGIKRRPSLAQVLPVLAGLLENLPFSVGQPFVLAIPLNHGYGVATLAISLALGSPLHLAERYDIEAMLNRDDDLDGAVLLSVPTLLHRWIANGTATSSPRLSAVITGSAPLSEELSQRLLQELGPKLFNLYGSTEAGLISLATPADLAMSPGTVGRPLVGNSVRVCDASGDPVKLGELGRLQVCGPLILNPDADGWFDTGDLGQIDAHGFLNVKGRADSMIVSGGENVYPHEVENVLKTHPCVFEVAIVVVKDEEFAHKMVAAVVLERDGTLDGETLREWLKQRLERFKVPRRIVVVPVIPHNSLGKTDRVALLKILERQQNDRLL